jgi:NADP-dependent 3-hydroxy acid dehydrogenase YdfG
MKQKVVIISGASSGIGLALAEKFLAEGSVVVINGRDERKLQQAAIKLNDISATVKAIPGDVSNIKD